VDERRRRMQSLREAVYHRTVFDWAEELLHGALAAAGGGRRTFGPRRLARRVMGDR